MGLGLRRPVHGDRPRATAAREDRGRARRSRCASRPCGGWDTAMTAASDPLAQMIDPDESFGAMFTHALHILPVALALVLPVVALGTALLYWVRRGSLTTTMTVLVLVPIIAMHDRRARRQRVHVQRDAHDDGRWCACWSCSSRCRSRWCWGTRSRGAACGSGRHASASEPRRRRGASWWRGSATTCVPRWPASARWPRPWPTVSCRRRRRSPGTRTGSAGRAGGCPAWSTTCSSCPGSPRARCS